ncbi:hypothetical protein Dimus_023278 [Dionaea muscipula]
MREPPLCLLECDLSRAWRVGTRLLNHELDLITFSLSSASSLVGDGGSLAYPELGPPGAWEKGARRYLHLRPAAATVVLPCTFTHELSLQAMSSTFHKLGDVLIHGMLLLLFARYVSSAFWAYA